MSYSPIGDTIALTKLAYALYSRVIVVARDAPEQFEALLQDLDTYKRVLYRIRSQADHDSDPSYSVAVQDVLDRCFRTLYGLRDLTTKYENLCECNLSSFMHATMLIISKHGVTVVFSLSASHGPKTRMQLKSSERSLENTSSSFNSS